MDRGARPTGRELAGYTPEKPRFESCGGRIELSGAEYSTPHPLAGLIELVFDTALGGVSRIGASHPFCQIPGSL